MLYLMLKMLSLVGDSMLAVVTLVVSSVSGMPTSRALFSLFALSSEVTMSVWTERVSVVCVMLTRHFVMWSVMVMTMIAVSEVVMTAVTVSMSKATMTVSEMGSARCFMIPVMTFVTFMSMAVIHMGEVWSSPHSTTMLMMVTSRAMMGERVVSGWTMFKARSTSVRSPSRSHSAAKS